MIFLKMSEDACAQMVYVNHLGVVWVDNECVIPSTDQYHYLCKGVYIGKYYKNNDKCFFNESESYVF